MPESRSEIHSGDVLRSVSLKGRIEDMVLTMSIIQSYKNDSVDNLKVEYNFPMGHGAIVTGFKARTVGKERAVDMADAGQAEPPCEDAIGQGGTDVTLEKSSEGVNTVNIGNFSPGLAVEVEIEYFQPLRIERGRIRVVVPTFSAPRYGDHYFSRRPKEHKSYGADILVEYPLSMTLDIAGELSKSAIRCPSHPATIAVSPGLATVILEPGALLLRDLIIHLDDPPSKSFALTTPALEAHAVMAGFHPSFVNKRQPLTVSVLLDCSGSMAGESMSEAKEAVRLIAQRLNKDDFIWLSKFEHWLDHSTKGPVKATPGNIRRVLALAESAKAMGNSEISRALNSTLEILKKKRRAPKDRVLILITDCMVAGLEKLLDVDDSVRIFPLGVGPTPVEGHLRQLAEATGGAAQFVSLGESVSEAVSTIFHRLQNGSDSFASVDWGGKTLWASQPPKQIYSDETAYFFAFMENPPATPPMLNWEAGGVSQELAADSLSLSGAPKLTRMLCYSRFEDEYSENEYFKKKGAELALRLPRLANRSACVTDFEAGAEKLANFMRLHWADQMERLMGAYRGRKRPKIKKFDDEPLVYFYHEPEEWISWPLSIETAYLEEKGSFLIRDKLAGLGFTSLKADNGTDVLESCDRVIIPSGFEPVRFTSELADYMHMIVESILQVLERAPAELAEDVDFRHRGFDDLIRSEHVAAELEKLSGQNSILMSEMKSGYFSSSWRWSSRLLFPSWLPIWAWN